MAIQVYEVGREGGRVVVIDDFLADPDALIAQAAALAPFPDMRENYYPGLRRRVTPDEGIFAYVDTTCQAVAPVMREIFGVNRFRITEAGFSLVTRPPSELHDSQRVPHNDSFSLDDFAVLHYLNRGDMGGTGFYRHRRSGYELVDAGRSPSWQAGLDADLAAYGPPAPAYFNETTPVWEKIGEVGWRFNRLLIYPGALFHSGLIPDDFAFSPDPLHGRLTGNIFLQAMR